MFSGLSERARSKTRELTEAALSLTGTPFTPPQGGRGPGAGGGGYPPASYLSKLSVDYD